MCSFAMDRLTRLGSTRPFLPITWPPTVMRYRENLDGLVADPIHNAERKRGE